MGGSSEHTAPRLIEKSQIVKATLHAGDTPGQIAHVLIEDHHLAPIPAIKALRDGGDMTPGEAKEIVHRSLPMDQHSAAEQLSEELIDYVERMADDNRQGLLQADRGCRAWSAADPAPGFGENAQIWQRHDHGPRQGRSAG
jgi:hypothetical protein